MKELLKKKSAFFGEFVPLHFETRVGGGPLSLSLSQDLDCPLSSS